MIARLDGSFDIVVNMDKRLYAMRAGRFVVEHQKESLASLVYIRPGYIQPFGRLHMIFGNGMHAYTGIE